MITARFPAGSVRRSKMKRKTTLLSFILAGILLLSGGCGKAPAAETAGEDSYTAYYLNLSEDDLVPFSVTPQGSSSDEVVQELLGALMKTPENMDCLSVIPTDVTVDSIVFSDNNVVISFGANYREMETSREILCRGAVVQTLCQIPEIDSVTFLVGGDPLTDLYGEEIGPMTKVSFLSSDGSDFTSYKASEVKLYYAAQGGQSIAPEQKRLRYNTVNPIERQIMKNLIEGPDDPDLLPVIPEGTRLLGISISDNICYVNLSQEFLNKNPGLSDAAVVYSVVNSLVEGTDAIQVQIAVGGNTDNAYGNVNLSIPLSEDLSFVESE